MSSASATPVLLPREGDVIAGKYAIVRVLGEGGMGAVFEATHLKLRQPVAVKVLLPAMLKHPVVVERFAREARAAGRLRSRHVVRVSDVDVTPDGLPYMVMELLAGHDLDVELQRRGRLPPEEAVDYVLQACAAMVEAHGLGIVHRDLKPSNVFLETSGEERTVKVLDFGISKVAADDDAKLTDAGAVMGTAMYMSPEQVRAAASVDARTDVWALGVVLYEALAGRPPWLGSAHQIAAAIVTEDPPALRSFADVPDGLVAVVARALRRSADERFPNVRELAAALAPFARPGSLGRAFADGVAASSRPSLPVLAPAPTTSAPVVGAKAPAISGASPAARRRALLVAGAAALALGSVGAGIVVARGMRADGARTPAIAPEVAAQDAASPAASASSVASSGASSLLGEVAAPSSAAPAASSVAPAAPPATPPAKPASAGISSGTSPGTSPGTPPGGATGPSPPAPPPRPHGPAASPAASDKPLFL